MIFIPFASLTYVLSTINVRRKYGSYGHRIYIANSNPSLLNRIVHDSYDLHVKRLFVLRCTLSNFNGNFNATISQGVTTGKINRARTKHIYVRPVVIEALGKNFSLSLLLIRYTRRWIGGIIIGIVYL